MSRRSWRKFAEPLAVLPFGFVGIRFYELGFDWVGAIAVIVLLFIYIPIIIVFWSGGQ